MTTLYWLHFGFLAALLTAVGWLFFLARVSDVLARVDEGEHQKTGRRPFVKFRGTP